MRIPLRSGNDYFSKEINSAFNSLAATYLAMMTPQINMKKADVLLGDMTVIQSNTFNPQKVMAFYQHLINSLEGRWATTGISRSRTDDLDRLNCQFIQVIDDKYYIHGYFGIQFHVLPYYRVDKRVAEIQKELTQIDDMIIKTTKSMATKGNDLIQKELEKTEYSTEMGFEELFTKLLEDKKLISDLEGKVLAVEKEFPEFEEMHNKKTQLFAELNDLVIELYQISPVLMDYNKLMQGEDGVVIYFDIERIKNQKTKERDSYINTKRITKEVTKQIVTRLNQLTKKLEEIGIKEYETIKP
jgi:hypothetical protein